MAAAGGVRSKLLKGPSGGSGSFPQVESLGEEVTFELLLMAEDGHFQLQRSRASPDNGAGCEQAGDGGWLQTVTGMLRVWGAESGEPRRGLCQVIYLHSEGSHTIRDQI